MARRSPQTERLVDVIEFLAQRPEGHYRLTELARAVGADKATCYPMLTELTRAGWLVKDPKRKTYQLGPRLGRIGAAAAPPSSLAVMAKAEMTDLSRRLGCLVALIVPSADDLVIAEVARTDGNAMKPDLQPGDRISFQPPLGTVLVAWSDVRTVDAWLGRDPGSNATFADYWRVLTRIRERHYAVELVPTMPGRSCEATVEQIGRAYGSARADSLAAVLGSAVLADMPLIDDTSVYAPLSINAAVFNAPGYPIAVLCAADLSAGLTGAQIHEIGIAITDAAERITRLGGGCLPWKDVAPSALWAARPRV